MKDKPPARRGFGFVPRAEGRYSPASARAEVKRRDKEECLRRGVPWHEGESWTTPLLDALLDAYLDRGLTYLAPAGACLLTVTGRSRDGVWTALWKAATRYRGPGIFFDYEPAERADRRGHPFHAHDDVLIAHACGPKGIPNGAHRAGRLAVLLGREFEEVQAYLERAAKADKRPQGVPAALALLDPAEHLARRVHAALYNAAERAAAWREG